MMLILFLNTVPYVCVFFLIETPFFYYKNKDVVNLFKCLVDICKINFPKKDIPKKIQEIRNALKYHVTQSDKNIIKDNNQKNNKVLSIISFKKSGNVQSELDNNILER